jgi:hypothetical protein
LFNALEALPPAINNAGQVAFTATLVIGGSVTMANDRGLWAGSPGNVSLVAREGDVIDLDPGPGELLRTIQSFSFANGLSVSGGTNFSSADAAFNDAGQIAWQAQFTAASGGGTAIFLTTLPTDDPPLDGDYNDDGVVDAADYVWWRKHDGTPAGYNAWTANFGLTSGSSSAATGSASALAVPEPGGSRFACLATLVPFLCRKRF